MKFPPELMKYILKIKTFTYEQELAKRCRICHFRESEWCTMAKCGYCYKKICERGVYRCDYCNEDVCFKHPYYMGRDGGIGRLCEYCYEDLEKKKLDLREVREENLN